MEAQQGSHGTAFLTGAFGGVGEWLIVELIAAGYAVVAFDKASPPNRAKADRLAKSHRFRTVWGDLTQRDALATIVAEVRPDVVVHAAAVIPPLTIKRPEIGEAVNVDGTRHLVDACRAAGSVARFVLVSSYSVLGPSNPNDDPPLWTSATTPNPQDDYARQKIAAEKIVEGSGLEWSIVRLCAVFPLSVGAMDPDTMRFSFVLPFDRREQAIDVRDAAFAISNATHVADAANRMFVVGGGTGWQGRGGDLGNAVMASSGLPPFPRTAFRLPDPAVADSWYYENWVDTTESQRVLRYQRHSFEEYLAERVRLAGFGRHAMRILGRVIRHVLLTKSPYHGRPQRPDASPFADAVKAVLAPR